MNQVDLQQFPIDVVEQVKFYVYRLIDPRNGETFYVGKGKGNRLFAHIRGNDDSEKIDRIRKIHAAGFEVAHVVHRHGLDEKTAFEVEAALIDAYPGLTNVAEGAGSGDRGTMHALEIVQRYYADPAIFQHRVILINVNRSAESSSLYDACRYAWRINVRKAQRAEYVAAVIRGMIRDLYVPLRWLPATQEHFPHWEPVPGRYGFVGQAAPGEARRLYLNKRIPDEYRKQGAANPIKYTYR